MPSQTNVFTTIRTEGALLPPDLLQRISDGTTLEGLTPESYHSSGEKLNEVINRSWTALQGAWANFKSGQARLPESDLATSLTRERWLLPLFRELDYGRLQTTNAVEIGGRSYPISHAWKHVPIHLVSYKVELDRRTQGVAGASSASPHSMMQVFLNRSQDNLWGILSNGYKLRILRDNLTLTRQAYVEFDLEAMMEGEIYSDFVLLWLLCHQSRFEMETFPIVKRKDEATHGEYRTKRVILAMYDQMAGLPVMPVPTPKDAGVTYAVPDVRQWQTWLTPAPADAQMAHHR